MECKHIGWCGVCAGDEMSDASLLSSANQKDVNTAERGERTVLEALLN